MATLLYIEDNENNQLLVQKGLNEHQISTASNSRDGLELARSLVPDIILLDVNLPDKSGYEICEELRAEFATASIPVIFISGMTTLEDRLKGYKSGGDDYVCKPVDMAELSSKVLTHLNRRKELSDLAQRLQYASSTAMLAMTTGGETGTVLNFVIDTYECHDYPSLAHKTFEFLSNFAEKGCLQIRGVDDVYNYSYSGSVSPLEKQILDSAAQTLRIVTVGNKTVFNSAHATLLIKNMPISDAELMGRMRDNLALALKGINARIHTLRLAEAHKKQRHEKMFGVLQLLRDQIQEIDQYIGGMNQKIHVIAEELLLAVQDHLSEIGLTHSQEQDILEILRMSHHQLHDLQDHSEELDGRFLQLEASLIEATLI